MPTEQDHALPKQSLGRGLKDIVSVKLRTVLAPH